MPAPSEFGERVLAAIPAERLPAQKATPLEAAFKHLTFALEDLEGLLKATAFEGNYLIGIGKAEWQNLKWEKAIPAKLTIVNSASFLFSAAETPEMALKAQEKLRKEGVSQPLLHCSDAHYPSDSKANERIGHCHTWLKADPTFAGLRQVLQDPHARIYLGDKPPKLALVEQSPTRFIRGITIGRRAGADLKEDWFDNDVPLSTDLVAIIGNKGMGKSALSDILALTGDADAPQEAYGFLDKNYFRDAENKASAFTATISWESGRTATRGLDEAIPPGTVPLVRYIPQHHFERVCNETADPRLLQNELQKVIFSHLSPSEQLGHSSLHELITARTGETDRQIAQVRAQLTEVNSEIIALERELTAVALQTIKEELELKKTELATHDSTKPVAVPEPTASTPAPDLDATVANGNELGKKLEAQRERLRDLRLKLGAATDLESRLRDFEDFSARLEADCEDDLRVPGFRFEDLVSIRVNLEVVVNRREEIERDVAALDVGVEETQATRDAVKKKMAEITNALDEPNRLYQRYLKDLRSWEERRRAIIGAEHEVGSIKGLTARLESAVPISRRRLTTLGSERARFSRKIHQLQLGKATFQRGLYARLQERLSKSPLIATKLPLEFDAHLVDTGFAARFNQLIHHGTTGEFSESSRIEELLKTADINDETSLVPALERVVEALFASKDVDNVTRQLKKDSTLQALYNTLFGLEHLEARYRLQIKGRELSQLTPGERGSVLLVFYLLADKDDRPLVIDQPEENLDNESVVDLVAPCIEEAKTRRQIIVVTHNPNLAVFCDAEQIIWCHVDKEGNFKVTYETGSLENPAMNKRVVDVLEGTWPAFTKRERKYQAP